MQLLEVAGCIGVSEGDPLVLIACLEEAAVGTAAIAFAKKYLGVK